MTRLAMNSPTIPTRSVLLTVRLLLMMAEVLLTLNNRLGSTLLQWVAVRCLRLARRLIGVPKDEFMHTLADLPMQV